MNTLSVNQISSGYGKQNIIKNISFHLEGGCLAGILGANGSGKTTLLKALCGILPHQGSCLLNQTALEMLSPRKLARLVSYIPQKSGIAIDISALDVVLMGFNPRLGLLEHPGREMKNAARQALAQAGLAGREEENYLHLSEGQKQLCILARTLVSDSRLLLLDEPESALDFRFRHQMLALLKRHTISEKCIAIVALHDPYLALNFCDRLLLLSEGKLSGSIEPGTDSPEQMEQMLHRIYGPVSLQQYHNRRGETRLVLLREEEL